MCETRQATGEKKWQEKAAEIKKSSAAAQASTKHLTQPPPRDLKLVKDPYVPAPDRPQVRIPQDRAEWFYSFLPEIVKGLDVAEVSGRDDNGIIVIKLKDGRELFVRLGDADEFHETGFKNVHFSGYVSSLKVFMVQVEFHEPCEISVLEHQRSEQNARLHEPRKFEILAADTAEGQKRMFLIAATKALAPLVALQRGMDPAEYTDRAVHTVAFGQYHAIWPVRDERKRRRGPYARERPKRAVRREMVEAFERELRKKRRADGWGLPLEVIPHAHITEYYQDTWWKRHRPGFFDVAPLAVPFWITAVYGAIGTVEELSGALASTNHAQRMRYVAGIIPALLRRCIPMHIRFALLGETSHYSGPFHHALEPRRKQFIVPNILTGLAEANAKGLVDFAIGAGDNAAANIINSRKSLLALISWLADALDPQIMRCSVKLMPRFDSLKRVTRYSNLLPLINSLRMCTSDSKHAYYLTGLSPI